MIHLKVPMKWSDHTVYLDLVVSETPVRSWQIRMRSGMLAIFACKNSPSLFESGLVATRKVEAGR